MPPLENAPDTSFPVNTATKEPLMFGPNISDHYHGFGNNNENNGGNFAAVSSSTSFPKYGNTGVRGWNGSGGGGGFNGTVGNCNMVTTGAKAAAQQVQPASIRVLAIIKI